MTDKPTNIDKVCPLCGGTKDNPQRIGSDPIDDATYICVDWFHGSGTVQPPKPNYITCNIKGSQCIRPTHKHHSVPTHDTQPPIEEALTSTWDGHVYHFFLDGKEIAWDTSPFKELVVAYRGVRYLVAFDSGKFKAKSLDCPTPDTTDHDFWAAGNELPDIETPTSDIADKLQLCPCGKTPPHSRTDSWMHPVEKIEPTSDFSKFAHADEATKRPIIEQAIEQANADQREKVEPAVCDKFSGEPYHACNNCLQPYAYHISSEPDNTDEGEKLNPQDLVAELRNTGLLKVSHEDAERLVEHIQTLITAAEIRGYKKGYAAGAIDQIKGTACPICGADPMTANCNGGNCEPVE